MNHTLRPVSLSDAPEIARIYNTYVRHDYCTFETEALSDREMEQRIAAVTERFPYIVMASGSNTVGFAYARPYIDRKAYDPTAQVSIYLDSAYKGHGFGNLLMERLIADCFTGGFHSLIGIISLPNPASVKLHERAGFTLCGIISQAGYKFETYYDTGLWQRML